MSRTVQMEGAISQGAAPLRSKSASVSGGALKRPYTKVQVLNYLAESAELSKKDIVNVFEALDQLMAIHLDAQGPGEFTLPGLLKCVVKQKPATAERKGVHPFSGEPITIEAKPARRVVKLRALKRLRDMLGD